VAQQPGRKQVPKYRQVAEDLRARIESGEYQAGMQLPTKAELMEHYSAALATVDHALDELRKLGLVETRQGVGTFACSPPPAEEAPSRERLAAELESVRRQVGLLEARLMNLYQSVAVPYPYGEDDEAGATVQPVRRGVAG
jgi:DNA-binding GntR family transcriptional regulator